MYSLRNLLKQEPNAITAVVMLGANLLVMLGVVGMTALQLGGLNAFLLATLNLFYVRPLTASKAGLEKLVTKKTKKK